MIKTPITTEITQVGGSGFTSSEDAAVYLIHTPDHAALVDAGCGRYHTTLMKRIKGHGILPGRLEFLLLTHCHFDHTGGAAAIADACRCPVIAHEMDAVYLEEGNSSVTAASWYGAEMEPLPVDRKLSGKEITIRLGDRVIKAIHVPGHTPGSLVYLMESEGKRVLFGQDVHGPLDEAFHSDLTDYHNSLERMMTLEADILCEGHYGIIQGKDRVKEFIQSFLPRIRDDR